MNEIEAYEVKELELIEKSQKVQSGAFHKQDWSMLSTGVKVNWRKS